MLYFFWFRNYVLTDTHKHAHTSTFSVFFSLSLFYIHTHTRAHTDEALLFINMSSQNTRKGCKANNNNICLNFWNEHLFLFQIYIRTDFIIFVVAITNLLQLRLPVIFRCLSIQITSITWTKHLILVGGGSQFLFSTYRSFPTGSKSVLLS